MKIRLLIKTSWGRVRCQFQTAGRMLLILAAAGLGTLTLAAETNVVTVGKAKAHPTRILAKYKEQVILEASSNVLRQAGSRVERRYRQIPQLAVLEATAASIENDEVVRRNRLIQRINDLKRTGLFEYVEPDYLVAACLTPTDLAFTDGSLWGLKNTGQNGGVAGADIAAPAAWDLTTGSTNVIVAVIDTGIRYTHRDLAAQMWRNPGESGGGKETNGKDDDNDGYVDNVFGINAITGSGNPMDDNDHGTHCAGTIGAAANDGNPHVGVNWRVRLMACKFLPAAGGGSTSDAITCIDFAVSKGVKILNNSWGGGGFSQALYDSINAARAQGVLFVAAAGNAASDNDADDFYPANYNLDNIVSVAALTRNDQLASFSNYGQKSVDLGAPGETIFSSTATSDTSYENFSGTSMAAPHVAGVAGLILSRFPAADLSELRERILLGAVPIPALNGFCSTGGRLNAYNSLTVSGSGVLQVSVNPPSGASLLAASSQPIYVAVTDLFPVTDATVTGTIAGGGNLTFLNDGQPPDVVASNGVYSALLAVPAATNPVTLTVTVSAPGKLGVTNTLTYNVLPPPPNDYFTNATKVPSGGGLYVANNRFATLEPNEPNHASVTNVAGSLWWVWTPVSSTSVFVDTTGSAIDSVLAVYTGNSLTNLISVVATNDIALNKQAYLSFNATGGTAYRIAVASAGTNVVGSLQLRITPGGQLDTTPPQVFVNTPSSGSTVTNSLIAVAGTANDPAPNVTGISEVFVSVNGSIAYTASGTTNWTAPALLQPGLNVIVVTALDAAGNLSPSVTRQVNYLVINPVNDSFASALPLDAVPEVSSASTTNATKQFNEPNHAGNNGGKSVWWWFQPPADGVLTLSTTNSNFDTLLGVYVGSSVSALTTVASNDDAYDGAPTGFSLLTVAVRSNQIYRIAVDGYDGLSGAVTLHYSFTPSAVFRLTVVGATNGTVQPTSGDFASNATVVLTATPDAYYTFSAWGGDVVSAVNPLSLVISSNLTVSAAFAPVVFTDGFESGNLLEVGWVTGGTPWIVTNGVSAAGQWSARSGPMTDNQVSQQVSSLILTTNSPAGTASFAYRVSSEPSFDYLKFSLNGVEQQRWSGEVGWANYVIALAAGTNTLRWDYVKDASVSAGLDAAFLDNVNLFFGIPINETTPATLTMVRHLDGSLLVQVLGQTNQQYVIQGATSLAAPVTWQNLSTNIATGGVIQYVDPGTTTNPLRFYRAVVP